MVVEQYSRKLSNWMEGQKIYLYANYLSSKGVPFYLYDN